MLRYQDLTRSFCQEPKMPTHWTEWRKPRASASESICLALFAPSSTPCSSVKTLLFNTTRTRCGRTIDLLRCNACAFYTRKRRGMRKYAKHAGIETASVTRNDELIHTSSGYKGWSFSRVCWWGFSPENTNRSQRFRNERFGPNIALQSTWPKKLGRIGTE